MRIRGDSGPATAEAFSQRYASAYRVVYRLLGDPHVADVLARDALVRSGSRLRRGTLQALEARGCRHAATLALSDELWLGRSQTPADGTGFGDPAGRHERLKLRMAVRLLAGRRRTLFILEHLAGWPPEQVAAQLSLNPDSYARLSARVLETVQRRMADDNLATVV